MSEILGWGRSARHGLRVGEQVGEVRWARCRNCAGAEILAVLGVSMYVCTMCGIWV